MATGVTISCFPLDPEQIIRHLQAKMLPGNVKFPNYRLAWLCSDGATTVYTFALPAGWICIRRGPVKFLSSSYDRDINLKVLIDGYNVTPVGMVMDNEVTLDFGLNYIKRKQVDFIVANDSGGDVYVTMEVQLVLITTEFFKQFYEPLIGLAYDAAVWLVEQHKGGKQPWLSSA